MYVDHITFHLSRDELGYTVLAEIMELVGFEEVEPDDPFEHGYNVRWFRRVEGAWASGIPLGSPSLQKAPKIHFVADGASLDVKLGLGHFCVVVGRERFEACRRSDYCSRDSGSGRCWLEYNGGRLRIEVRP